MAMKLQLNGNNGYDGAHAQYGYEHTGNGRGYAAEVPAGYQAPRRFYDRDFIATEAYRRSLPDLQNGPASTIQGSVVAIQQVGIHNFRLPLRYAAASGEALMLETSVTGTVSLEAHLFDTEGRDLYGETLRDAFMARLR